MMKIAISVFVGYVNYEGEMVIYLWDNKTMCIYKLYKLIYTNRSNSLWLFIVFFSF